jgi:hypothetical protein
MMDILTLDMVTWAEMADFPRVICPEHGVQSSYLVCTHVIRHGAVPVHILVATDRDMGEILCERSHADLGEMCVICARHCERWLLGGESLGGEELCRI